MALPLHANLYDNKKKTIREIAHCNPSKVAGRVYTCNGTEIVSAGEDLREEFALRSVAKGAMQRRQV